MQYLAALGATCCTGILELLLVEKVHVILVQVQGHWWWVEGYHLLRAFHYPAQGEKSKPTPTLKSWTGTNLPNHLAGQGITHKHISGSLEAFLCMQCLSSR